jgi:hypothetical protein
MTCAANSPHVDRLGVSLRNRGVWLSDGFYTSMVQYVHRRCTYLVAMHRLSCRPKSSLASLADPVRPDHSHKYVAGFGKLDIPFVYSATTVGCFRSLA